MAAIYYFYNKMNTYQLSPEKPQKESTYIQEILKNNGYNNTVLEITPKRVKLKQDKNKTQWAKFTYWKRNERHHKGIQEHQPKNCIFYK
jgi:hypothetical protein